MLKSLMRRYQDEESGFTLIELLIVIIILGVLAAIVVFSVSGVQDTGEEAACQTEQRTLETAIEAFRAQEGSYPTAVGDLVPGFLRSNPEHYGVGANGAITGSCP